MILVCCGFFLKLEVGVSLQHSTRGGRSSLLCFTDHMMQGMFRDMAALFEHYCPYLTVATRLNTPM